MTTDEGRTDGESMITLPKSNRCQKRIVDNSFKVHQKKWESSEDRDKTAIGHVTNSSAKKQASSKHSALTRKKFIAENSNFDPEELAVYERLKRKTELNDRN